MGFDEFNDVGSLTKTRFKQVKFIMKYQGVVTTVYAKLTPTNPMKIKNAQ